MSAWIRHTMVLAAATTITVAVGHAQPQTRTPAATARPAPAAQWQALVGRDTDALRGWISGVLPKGWHVSDGTLSKEGKVEDLLTRQQYGNFELEFEWNIGNRGVSGVVYRATREYDKVYWSGPEYPLLGGNAPEAGGLDATGSVSGLYPAAAGAVSAAGDWNTSRIVVMGTHVEHWLNGRKVLTYELGGAAWKAQVAASRFGTHPKFGLARRGFIAIRGDQPGALALRQLRIRELQ